MSKIEDNALIPKDELIQTILADKRAAEALGETWEAGLNLANLIASNALYRQRLRDGSDYMSHSITVAFMETSSPTKHIIGILHDVVEDSDWTLDDLRLVGFSERIVQGVDGVTKRDGEMYFDFVERCGLSGEDAIDVKIKDLTHNSDQSRTPTIVWNEKQMAKMAAYNVSKFYLIAIKRGEIEPGTPIVDFIRTVPEYANEPFAANKLLEAFSSNEERLRPYAPGGTFNPAAQP